MRIVGEEVGMKKSNAKKKKEPILKRMILSDTSRLWKDLSTIEALFAGIWKKREYQKMKSKAWAKKKRVYIGNGRAKTE